MTPSAAPFRPDTCQSGAGGIDWSSIASAESMSAFCGIMAGFVFAGLVTVIGQKNPPGGDAHASRALKLLLPCFIGLAMASYLYALTSGELVCTRAITEQLFSGAILATDALLVIVALAWLLPAYGRNKHGEVRFFRGLILFAAQFSILMLTVSSDGFTKSVLHGQTAGWATTLVWSSGGVCFVAVCLSWRAPLPSIPPVPAILPPGVTAQGWDEYCRDESFNHRVARAVKGAVTVGGLLAVAGGCAVGLAYTSWTSMQPWLVYPLAEAALLLPATVIAAGVWAVPRD
ncbi:hypothetical protein ACFWFU_04580 [Streptomyces sp. NPDC060235]|uniref:hypothetical protein n=1 Tax=Streptomyces sp. NPDC060235 TaxID=3347080 RepID=UPI00365A02AC